MATRAPALLPALLLLSLGGLTMACSAPDPTLPPAGRTTPAPGGDHSPPAEERAATPTPTSGQAPAQFRVRFHTTAGDFVVESRRAWAPHGVDRFHDLVTSGFFADVAFFRVVPGFMVQFGIHGVPDVAARWRQEPIPDDPVLQSNTRGMMSYAMAGPGTRTSQLFINFVDNQRLDEMGFAPIAKVVEGMDIVDKIFPVGEGPPGGPGPHQKQIEADGNE